MDYTTYEYYTDTYYGELIPQASFAKWLSRATDELSYICFNAIDDEALEMYPNEIAKATCALMDVMYKLDVAEQNATDPTRGNIKSMSSGGQSISFGNNDTIYTNALGSVKEQYRIKIEVITKYLADTGLLYAGV